MKSRREGILGELNIVIKLNVREKQKTDTTKPKEAVWGHCKEGRSSVV